MDKEVSTTSRKPTDHLANERTFLAWIRTSIGIMAFGFVVEKFNLFIRQISYVLGKKDVSQEINLNIVHTGYSSVLGIFFVVFGILLGLFSYINYKVVERQIEQERYRPTSILAFVLTVVFVIFGSFLVVYLVFPSGIPS